MMLLNCWTQYARKFGNLNSGHRIGKGQFSFQSQRNESEVTQSCPTLCHPLDYSLPSSTIHVIFQARAVEWVSISFFRGSFQPRDRIQVSHIVGKCFYHLSHQGSPKKGNAKECSNYCRNALISHTSKVMIKILQARLQQYMNWELPDIPAGFRKGRGNRDQIVNIHWNIEKAREFQKKHLLLPHWLC